MSGIISKCKSALCCFASSRHSDQEQIITGEQTEYQDESNQNLAKGLSVGTAAVFIVGTMCGSGILALPKALVDCGWSGLPLLIICGLLSSYTGNILGKCWIIVRERYPEYEHQYLSDPYPTIGFRAAGKWGRIAARVCIILTLFGGATVFLLLSAGNISNLVKNLGHGSFHTCYSLLVVVAVMTPFTWLGTPKDFWQAGIIAAVSTAIGGILIVIGLAIMNDPSQSPVTHSNPSFVSFFNAFGTILFAFGGASCFPNIQIDMKNPNKFPLSVVIGISFVLALYIPVSLSGFIVLGDNMKESNILDEMDGNGILYAVIILITSHLLMAFLIVCNPINQDLEGFFDLPDKFTWKRCLLRSGVSVFMLFVALSIPKFGVILSLVGGTTVTATNFVFPPLFYILLSRQKTAADGYGNPPTTDNETVYTAVSGTMKNAEVFDNSSPSDKSSSPSASQVSLSKIPWTVVEIPTYQKLLLIEIILIGVVGGVASTYSVLSSLIDGSAGFTVPCYLNWAVADPS